jgi:hypothetical protein
LAHISDGLFTNSFDWLQTLNDRKPVFLKVRAQTRLAQGISRAHPRYALPGVNAIVEWTPVVRQDTFATANAGRVQP